MCCSSTRIGPTIRRTRRKPPKANDGDDRVRREKCDKNRVPARKQVRHIECRVYGADRLALIVEIAVRESGQVGFVNRHRVQAVARRELHRKCRIGWNLAGIGGGKDAPSEPVTTVFDREATGRPRTSDQVCRTLPKRPPRSTAGNTDDERPSRYEPASRDIAFLYARQPVENPLRDRGADHHHQHRDDGRNPDGQRDRVPAVGRTSSELLHNFGFGGDRIEQLGESRRSRPGATCPGPPRLRLSCDIERKAHEARSSRSPANDFGDAIGGKPSHSDFRTMRSGLQVRLDVAHHLPDVAIHTSRLR